MARWLSTLFTSIPAALWMLLVILSKGNDYYRPVYVVTCGVFLAVSLAIGFLGPTFFPQAFKRRPGLWIFGQGLLAWMAAILVPGLLNVTPLCVGQDNGNGIMILPYASSKLFWRDLSILPSRQLCCSCQPLLAVLRCGNDPCDFRK
jgi:hypothetical protein